MSGCTDPARVALRSIWRRLGVDAFEVRCERPNGSEWITELTVVQSGGTHTLTALKKAPPAALRCFGTWGFDSHWQSAEFAQSTHTMLHRT